MSLPAALWLASAVWSLLLLGAVSKVWLGRDAATLGASLLATLLVVRVSGRAPACSGRSGQQVALGAIAGLSSWPAWQALLDRVFGLLGLAWPAAERMSAPSWLAALLLAPVCEELLYREHLLGALRACLGWPAALALSSLLFALQHGTPAAMVATWLVGAALGALRLSCSSVAPCVGAHAGLNLGAWLGAATGG